MMAYRYLRRFGARVAAGGLRLTAMGAGIAAIAVAARLSPDHSPIYIGTILYGIYAVTEALKGLHSVHIVTARTMDIRAGAVMQVSTGELDKAVDRIIAQERVRKAGEDA